MPVDTNAQMLMEKVRTHGKFGLSSNRNELLWSYIGDDNASCVRSIGDVNGDLIPDALISSGNSEGHQIFCVKGNSSGAA